MFPDNSQAVGRNLVTGHVWAELLEPPGGSSRPVTPGWPSPERSKHQNLHTPSQGPCLLRREVWDSMFSAGDRGTGRTVRMFKGKETSTGHVLPVWNQMSILIDHVSRDTSPLSITPADLSSRCWATSLSSLLSVPVCGFSLRLSWDSQH